MDISIKFRTFFHLYILLIIRVLNCYILPIGRYKALDKTQLKKLSEKLNWHKF